MIQSSLKRLAKGTFELTIVVPKQAIEEARKKTIDNAVKSAEIPGFRKGTAPRQRVESSLDKNKIYQEVLGEIIPRSYLEAIKAQNLKPILNPRIQLNQANQDQDLTFTAVSCETPEVKLGNYKEEVKKALTVNNLWVPGKNDQGPGKEKPDANAKLNKVIDCLLVATKIEPADILVEEETNHSLARLVDQTQQLGITVEQYLNSVGKTAETLRAEYATTAMKNLQTEFLLNEIAKDLKISISEKEVDEIVASAPDEKSRESLNTPSQRATLKAILTRRHALDTLASFA